MIFRTEKEAREGYVAMDIGDAEYRAPADEYEYIIKEYKAGHAFLDTHTLYGEKTTVKLARVIGIILVTPEAMAARDRDEEAKKTHNITEGDL